VKSLRQRTGVMWLGAALGKNCAQYPAEELGTALRGAWAYTGERSWSSAGRRTGLTSGEPSGIPLGPEPDQQRAGKHSGRSLNSARHSIRDEHDSTGTASRK
jgi:hypothetical protein